MLACYVWGCNSESTVKLHVLGSNGWYATGLANTVCILLETKDYYLVLDAGDGLHKLDQYVKDSKPIYIFLSHFHLDHIIGLHTLPKFRFSQGITVYGQAGTEKILQNFVNRPFTVPREKLKLKVTVRDLPEGASSPPDVPLPIETGYLVHSDPCLGYRFEIDGKIVAYCTDTGYCENLVKLAKGADLLITECALGVKEQPTSEWPHLNPRLAAKAAGEAGVDKMLLTHFGPGAYPTKKDREGAKAAAEEVYSPVVIADDGLEMEI